MKDIVTILKESKAPRYCINVIIDGLGNDRRLTDNYKELLNSEWAKKASYYEVMDMKTPDFTDLSALVEWHGKGGYWANVYDDSKDPDNASKWATILKGKDLEELERKKK